MCKWLVTLGRLTCIPLPSWYLGLDILMLRLLWKVQRLYLSRTNSSTSQYITS